MLLSIASCQAQSVSYVQHHKQTFSEDVQGRQTIYTKALTLVEESGATKYAYVASFRPSILKDQVTRPLLVKLKENLPITNAFDVEFAKTFLFQTEVDTSTPTANNEFLDVKDVHYHSVNEEGYYVLCGNIITEAANSASMAFILKTNALGNVLLFNRYPDIRVFNSIVSDQSEDGGYIAVGIGQKEKNSDSTGAIMLSVDLELAPRCAKDVRGSLQWNNEDTSGGFGSVIQYDRDTFAMVGSISDGQIQPSQNVLVTIANAQCEILLSRHYGKGVEVENGQEYRYNESGTSITAVGKHLFIAGVTQKSIVGVCTDPVFRDILLFRINRIGNVMFMKQYDYDGKEDIAFAITNRNVRTRPVLTSFPPKPTRPGVDLFIAGSSVSTTFNGKVENDDVFLLNTNMWGNIKSFEIFGGAWDDGAYQANMDLEITPDSNVLIQANTKSFTSKQATDQYTFLVERYDSILKQCYDLNLNLNIGQYPFPEYETSDLSIEVWFQVEKMVSVNVNMKKIILCDKKENTGRDENKKKEWEY